MRKTLLSTVAVLAVVATVASIRPVAADHDDKGANPNHLKTATPIKHLVVIFDENRSFDHYFGTYPKAMNPAGEPAFTPAANTPSKINNLNSNSAGLLATNPNQNVLNTDPAANLPFRLDRTEADSADQSHNYTREQQAYHNGAMDLFPLEVGKGGPGTTPTNVPTSELTSSNFATTGQVMGFFDGNTVTALWNYAQNFAMSDNAYTDTFGPSTPGLLNMWAGQTNGAVFSAPAGAKFFSGVLVPPTTDPAFNTLIESQGDAVFNSVDKSYTLIQDIDPTLDVCSGSDHNLTVTMTSKNVGDLLNAANIPWGSFIGGFNLQTQNINGSTGCQIPGVAGSTGRSSFSEVTGRSPNDYIQHHMWFQYYASTANPTHALPASIAEIGHNGPANHAYDLAEFKAAVGAGNFPAVSFVKQSAFQDGHPKNSNPLDEQQGLVELVNFLQQQPDWDSTAIIFTFDDSDGQYDHVAPPITHASFSTQDATNGTVGSNVCGAGTAPVGLSGTPVNGRCGLGFRIPFMVISPYAKKNFVSHTEISQASVTKFIEDNWLNGERLGGGSFDKDAGSIIDMFDFHQGDHDRKVVLDKVSGLVVETSK